MTTLSLVSFGDHDEQYDGTTIAADAISECVSSRREHQMDSWRGSVHPAGIFAETGDDALERVHARLEISDFAWIYRDGFCLGRTQLSPSGIANDGNGLDGPDRVIDSAQFRSAA